MFYNEAGDQRINMTAVTVSILVHLIFFIQITYTRTNNQTQAPNYSPEISINLMPFTNEPAQLVKTETLPPEPVRTLNPESEPALQTRPKINRPAPVFVPEQTVAPNLAQTVQRGQSNEAVQIRTHYLNNLLTYIEGNKYYPQAARYRGIEGSIEVSFQLLDNGEISNLKTKGEPKVLRKAAEQAVTMSLPLPVPPADVNCPLQVSYSMQFRLD